MRNNRVGTRLEMDSLELQASLIFLTFHFVRGVLWNKILNKNSNFQLSPVLSLQSVLLTALQHC